MVNNYFWLYFTVFILIQLLNWLKSFKRSSELKISNEEIIKEENPRMIISEIDWNDVFRERPKNVI